MYIIKLYTYSRKKKTIYLLDQRVINIHHSSLFSFYPLYIIKHPT